MKIKTTKSARLGRRVLCEVTLRQEILDLLTAAPRTNMELAIALRWSATTIYAQLEMLRFTKQAHRRAASLPSGRGGALYRWYIGPKPEAINDELEPAPVVPVRSNSYPLNHRRDPLVAALFGASPCSSIT